MVSECLIDTSKEYRTRSGKRVIGLKYVPKNSCGNLVTYPIKGSIVEKEKPLRLRFHIWSAEGLTNVVWPNEHKYRKDDLVEA